MDKSFQSLAGPTPAAVRAGSVALLCLILGMTTVLSSAMAGGLVRQTASSLKLPLQPVFEGHQLVDALPSLRFNTPVALLSPPGETNRLFVVERAGTVQVVADLTAPAKTTFLDLTASTASYNIESGLLGMAFHPGFATNGFLFVYRTTILPDVGYADIITRYHVSTQNPNAVDPLSATVVLSVPDPSDDHNAGDLHFGPDGYLYVALGDAGPFLASKPNKQALDDTLAAGILRIDVDDRPTSLNPNPLPGAVLNYTVPADNPFVGMTSYQGLTLNPARLRTEFYAIGLRNPWRMSFDAPTGRLFCGDVGSDAYEEVNLIAMGGNYGWPYREGWIDMDPTPSHVPADFPFQRPIAYYPHGNKALQGEAVIGGLVYRGSAIPELQGKYLFADNVRGHVWSLTPSPESEAQASVERLTGSPGISSFGTDPRDGEVLVSNHLNGAIEKLIRRSASEANIPALLSEVGAFSDLDSLAPAPGVIPYDVNLPFWSDHAIKSRFFAMTTPDASVGYELESNWTFPTGAVWVKHFDMELTNGVPESRIRLETRFLVRNQDGFYGLSYQWDESQTNATLVTSQGRDRELLIHGVGDQVRTQIWHYPTHAECAACHTKAGGYALGFSTRQLNKTHDYDGQVENQLTALKNAGYLEGMTTNPPASHVLVTATNTAWPLEYRARSYLAANCSQCHQKDSLSTLDAYWDGRVHTPLDETRLIGRYVIPGNPADSRILARLIASYDPMPPVGSTVINTNATNLIADWISSMPVDPWRHTDIGAVALRGSSWISQKRHYVSGAGGDIWGREDALQLLYQPLSGNVQITARLVGMEHPNSQANSGLMIRRDGAAGSPHAMVGRLGENYLAFTRRPQDAAEARAALVSTGEGQPWLRLVRKETLVSGYTSDDGTNWTLVGSESIDLGPTAWLGLASTSGDPNAFATAMFENLSIISARVSSPRPEDAFEAGATIPLAVEVTTGGQHVTAVGFYLDGEFLAELAAPPYQLSLSNALAGIHDIVGLVRDSSGAEFFTEPLSLKVTPTPAGVRSIRASGETGGSWQGRYGGLGGIIAGDSTNLPPQASVTLSEALYNVWEDPSSDPRALTKAGGAGSIGAAWFAPREILVDVQLKSQGWQKLTLYAVDWERLGRSQRVDILSAADGSLLESREMEGLSSGRFISWAVKGHVRIRVSTQGPFGAVLSGIFLDSSPNKAPVVELTAPADGSVLVLPENLKLAASASDEDGDIARVEFFLDGQKVGERASPPYQVELQQVTPGTHQIVVKATDSFGERTTSDARTVQVRLPSPMALFLKEDRTTAGGWIGRYGGEGFWTVADTRALPAFLALDLALAQVFIWQDPTSVPQALERADGTNRIAACWVDAEQVVMSAAFNDGLPHSLSLYFLDWDSVVRRTLVSLYAGSTDTLLDSRIVQDHSGGTYLSWAVQGEIRIVLSALQGNVVASGFFVDGASQLQPRLESISLEALPQGTRVALGWSSLAGARYAIQWKARLEDPLWKDLGETQTATGPVTTVVLELDGAVDKAFFRVLMVQ